MKSNPGLATVLLVLATACGSATEGSAGNTESGDTDPSSTGNSNSFPTTTDGPTASSNSNSGLTEGPTSGVTEGNSGGTDTTAATVSSVGDSSDTSETGPNTSTTGPGTTDTTTSTASETTAGESTMGVGDTGDTDTDTTTDPDTTGTTTDTTGDTGDTGTTAAGEDCGPLLDATIRDFSVQHPDFEKYGGNKAYKGLVLNDLGADQKPVYAAPGPTPQTSGPDAFKQWYNDTPNVNQAIQIQLMLTEIMPGIFQYKSEAFFPVDNLGFGNEGFAHNFAFTTEIHTQFIYNGGESFTFTGDDDMWMFINKKLAIDLGGLHPPDTQTINLDLEAAKLGIIPGGVYTMDIFHAERHSTGSNFRIDTTIGCFIPQ